MAHVVGTDDVSGTNYSTTVLCRCF